MGDGKQKKRSREFSKLDSEGHHDTKRQRLGRDHVYNTQVQSVHEASATSISRPIGGSIEPASTRRSSSATTPSSAPRSFAASVPHGSKVHQVRSQKSRPRHKNKPPDLPPLPPINDADLEAAVFTHSASLPGHNQNKLDKSYERLEFLGDAYVEVIATRLVYAQYPHMPAGRLSQQREGLVKNEALAEFSIAYGFEKRTLLPPRVSDISPPISQRTRRLTDPEKQYVKILGDVFEAYVAAIILSNPSNGYEIAEKWLHALWTPKLKAQDQAEVREPPAADSKSQLAAKTLGYGARLDYREIAPPDMSEKSSGKTWFTYGVFVTGWGLNEEKLGEGRALSIKQAEMFAASQALRNPLTAQIDRMKMERKRKDAEQQKAAEEAAAKADEQKTPRAAGPTSSEMEKSEDEKKKLSDGSIDSDESSDSED